MPLRATGDRCRSSGPWKGPLRVLIIVGDWPAPGRPVNTFTKVQVESLRELGVDCCVWNLAELGRGWKKYLRAGQRVARKVIDEKCDLVHAHFGYCGWVARGQRQRPVLLSFMGDDLLGTPNEAGEPTALSQLAVRWNRRLARRVDSVIVKTPEMARVLSPIPANIVPNGVDMDIFQPQTTAAARRQLGWDPRPKYILFPNNPAIPVKRFVLAQAAVNLASNKLGEKICLVPLKNVLHHEVPLYLNACDAMLMTSLHEGSPNTVKEAMACNLPVVSVPVGDVAELLDGLAGCRIVPRDSEALAGALAEVLGASARTEGRRRLLDLGLDKMSVAGRVLQIYRELR